MNRKMMKLTPIVMAALATCGSAWSQSPEEIAKIEAAVPKKATAEPKAPRKILVFSQTLGYKHASIPYGKKALALMGEKTGAYTAEVTDDPAALDPENLKKFDAILFNNTTGDIITTPTVQAALVDFVKSGKGLIGIHAATDTNYGWLAYGDLIGGYFDGHPWTSGDTVTVKIDEPGHPLTKAFDGKSFEITDEIYQMKEPYSRTHNFVLTSLDTDKTDMTKKGIKRTDKDFGISWVRQVEKGRVFYTSLGHNPHIYWNAKVLQHYLDGIQFALGDLDASTSAKKENETPGNKPRVTEYEAGTPPATVDEAISQLRGYDFGGDRAFLITLDKAFRETNNQPEERSKLAAKLVTVAKDDSVKYAARELALRRLELLGTNAEATELAGLLGSPDEKLAEMARIAITAIPGDAADKALLDALGTAKGNLRNGIITSLGKRQVAAAVKPLTDIARTDDAKAASVAVLAIGDIGTEESAKALLNDIRPADAVRGDWFDAMNDAASAVAATDKDLAGKLYARVLEMGKESPARLAAFKGQALLESNPEAAALNAMNDSDALVAQVARELLVRGKDQSITPKLLDLLANGKPEQKVAVAEILGARGDKSALDALAALAAKSDEGDELQIMAIRSVKTLGNEKNIPLLIKLAASEKGEVKSAAEAAIKDMPVPEVDGELVKLINEAITPEEQVEAIEAAAARKSAGTMEALLKAADKNNAKVAVAAFKAATEMGADSDLEPLLASLDKAQGDRVLKEAGRAVTATAQKLKSRGDAVNKVLGALAASKTDDVKMALLSVLGSLGTKESLDAIRENAKSANEKIKDAAIRALAAFPEESALDDLLKLASESDSEIYRVLAVRGVARLISEPSAKPADERLEMLKKSLTLAKNADDKKAILGAAGEMKVPGVLPLILPYLDQPEFKSEAVAALLKQAVVANHFDPAATAELLNPLSKKLDKADWDKLEEVLTPSDADGGAIRAWQASKVIKDPSSKNVSDLTTKEFPQEKGEGKWSNYLWAGIDEGDNKGQLNLTALFPGSKNSVIYLRAFIWSPEDRKARLDTASDDCIKAWLNGSSVLEVARSRSFTWWKDKTSVDLKRGWNEVIVKVINGSKDWQSAVRVTDADGKPYSDLKFSASPQK